MRGEQETARRVMAGYISSQLRSGIEAIKAAHQLGDGRLVLKATERYIYLAEVAQELYLDTSLASTKTNIYSHNLELIKARLEELPGIAWQRQKRLPRVAGVAEEQLRVIGNLLELLDAERLTLEFRPRDDELVMRYGGSYSIPEELAIASSRSMLLRVTRQPSLVSIRGYLLARRCDTAMMRMVVAAGVVYLHFQIIRQMKIPLS
ncbi:hypothetical protein IPM44_02360 [bacterium]|nr:MAG: hypothetical protein IPM44_02360 [bacterium]